MVDLYEIADNLSVMVREVRLTNTAGFYHPELRLVVVSTNLTPTQHRCTLAHELGHAHYDDHPTTDEALNGLQERRANEWAAKKLVTPHAYKEAEHECGPHIGAIAQHLQVTREIVGAWQDTYFRSHSWPGYVS